MLKTSYSDISSKSKSLELTISKPDSSFIRIYKDNIEIEKFRYFAEVMAFLKGYEIGVKNEKS